MEALIVFFIIAGIVLFLSLFFSFIPVGLDFGICRRCKVPIFTLIGMRLRRVIPQEL